uniref:Uncharacterized protein n=1 Tax=Anguilla anguilla TaxID=7936 RepID=A0A0E9WZK0_ANGAN
MKVGFARDFDAGTLHSNSEHVGILGLPDIALLWWLVETSILVFPSRGVQDEVSQSTEEEEGAEEQQDAPGTRVQGLPHPHALRW